MRFHQQTDLASPRNTGKSALGFLLALICMLFAVGCSGGGSNGGFVASPGGGNTGVGGGGSAGNGSVTFNFVKQQSAIVVGQNTTSLRFKFFTGLESTGVVVLNETRPFAASITFDSVPSSARSVQITALTTEGYPITEFKANLQITAGQNLTVSGTDGTTTPVTLQSVTASPASLSLAINATSTIIIDLKFSNNDVVRLSGALASEVNFTSSDTTVATVGTDGTVTALANGGTNIVANIVDFAGNSVTIPVTVGNGIVAPPTVASLSVSTANLGALTSGQTITTPVGTITEPFVVTATFQNGSTKVVTTAADGVVFSSNNAKFTFTSNQEVAVASTATPGTTATIVVNFGGASFNFNVAANAAVLSSISVTPSSVNLPFGGFEQTFSVSGQFSNNTPATIDPANVVVTGSSSTFSLNTSTLKLTTAASGTAAVTNLSFGVSNVAFPNNTVQPVTVPVTVGQVSVTSLTVTPNPLTLTPGQVQELTVVANLSQGGPIDVSNFSGLTLTAVNPNAPTINVLAKGKQVVAVGAGSASVNVNFGGAPTFVLPVTVQAETLVSVEYQFAGNPLAIGSTNNLPRGYVGVVEVVGTFNTGTVRKLTFNEYTLSDTNTGSDPDDMLALFDESYQIAPVQARYSDGNMYDYNSVTNPPATANVNAPTTFNLDVDGNEVLNVPVAAADDFLGGGSIRDTQVVSPTFKGSTDQHVVLRKTFRAIAADWPRGELDSPTNSTPVAVNGGVAPGSQEFFQVTISPSILDMNLPSMDTEFSVTITDPREVTFASAGFVNYPGEAQTPTGSVREFEVRVNFSEITNADTLTSLDEPAIGPLVKAQTNFKLAEANVSVFSNVRGQNKFAVNTPTTLGFCGVSSDVPVADNTIAIEAIPLAGYGIRPIALSKATRKQNLTPPDTYTEGTYKIVSRVFGPHFATAPFEDDGRSSTHDPGPPLPDFTAQNTRAPEDTFIVTVTELNNAVQFVRPFMFSIDPINVPANTPLGVIIGDSQLFRTLVQFSNGQAPVDRSLDYPPVLIASTGMTPGVSSFGDTGTGNLRVSGISTAGTPVVAADVEATTGFDTLAANADVASALMAGAHGIVVALDAAGEPIEKFGSYTGTVKDLKGNQGPAQSTATINAVAAP